MTVGSRTLPMATLGPHNPWPRFRFQIAESPVRAAADLSEEDRRGTFANAAVPPLPYLLQDNYARSDQLLHHRPQDDVPVVRAGMIALQVDRAGPQGI